MFPNAYLIFLSGTEDCCAVESAKIIIIIYLHATFFVY